MQTVNTFGLQISLTTKSGIFPVTLTGNGIAERPAKTYIQLKLFLQDYKILAFDHNDVYVKQLGSSNWEHPSRDQMDLPTSLLSDIFGLIAISEVAISPDLVGTEVVNGVICQQVNLSIDLPLYLARHAPEASRQIDLVASRARGDIWIGMDDLRIHKLYIEMEIVSQGETQPVNATIELSQYNEPVSFPAPPIP